MRTSRFGRANVDGLVEPVHAGLLAARGLRLVHALDVVVDLMREREVGREYRDRQQRRHRAEDDPADCAARPVGAGLPRLDDSRDADDTRRDPDCCAEDQQVDAPA
jgi:hypothetical protein